MKVKCKNNKGKFLDPRTLQEIHSISTEFKLAIGDVYNVYGISLWKGTLHYLTFDKYNTAPFWHPAELFTIEDNLLPLEWYHKFDGYNNGLQALWGYKELVYDDNHYERLIERDDEAIRIFIKRKSEIEEFMI